MYCCSLGCSTHSCVPSYCTETFFRVWGCCHSSCRWKKQCRDRMKQTLDWVFAGKVWSNFIFLGWVSHRALLKFMYSLWAAEATNISDKLWESLSSCCRVSFLYACVFYCFGFFLMNTKSMFLLIQKTLALLCLIRWPYSSIVWSQTRIIIYMTCFDLTSCHQKMNLMMSQSLVRPPRDIINNLLHGVMNLPPPVVVFWTCQLEKEQQL